MTALDRRLTPARPDLAAARLFGTVDATRYVEGTMRRVVAPVADLRAEPRFDCPLDSQALRGEAVLVYEETAEGWAWVELCADGYVGYLPSEALGPVTPAPTHRVSAIRTLVFPGPDLKLPVVAHLSAGALLTVVDRAETRGLAYGVLADRTAVVLKHLEPVGEGPVPDFVAAAQAYLGTPYLWGGRSAFGIDCSGLVQTALARAGVAAPRDSDLQEAAVGLRVEGDPDPAAFRRGDLLYSKGHVAIVEGLDRLLHATGFHMATVVEPLGDALARMAAAGSPVRTVRRLPGYGA